MKHLKAYLKKNYVIDENDPLSELNKIPLRSQITIVPMALFTSKSTSKLRSTELFRYSIVIPRFIPRANTAQT